MHDADGAAGFETDLEALVAACIEAQVAGDSAGVEQLLEGSPQLAAAARAQLEDLQRAGLLEQRPQRIGNYRVLDELGHGGMGTVYLAEQLEPVQRRVALKLIRPGMNSRDLLARFALERQSLAMMQHANVASVFDAGIAADGRPYFAMEYVDGLPITDHADLHRLTTDERLRLFLQACEGVQHAHLRGIIHRDLKPSNILVGVVDGRPVPKIIDFGIAKVIDGRLSSVAQRTEQGLLLGTPEYMSPEQADRDARDIDLRTDVYSLGIVLYELLTGALPFDSRELRAAGRLELQRKIREDEPERPSTKVTGLGAGAGPLAQARCTSAAALIRVLRGDLDWIVLRAIEKQPERRYDSVNDLAQDIARHLAHEPVLAGPPGATYRLRKLLRKHRGAAIATALVLITAIAGAAIATGFAARFAGKVAEFDQLAGAVLYERVIAAEQDLYPPWPRKLEAIERWLSRDCARLLAMRPEIEHTVASLRARAQSQTDDEAACFLHDTLDELLGKLAHLQSTEMVAVVQRRDWARRIGELTRSHPNARTNWNAARAAIAASARYAGQPLELADDDVTGLVPIGENPVTGLWEFYELRSAWDGTSDPAAMPIPRHQPDGTVEVTGETGIVFVLLPGGTFAMGAQRQSADLPNHDPVADDDEGPVHEISLAPFFLARHELTRGQWRRLSGGAEPSWHRLGQTYTGNPEPVGEVHAVEQVDWSESERLLSRHGLTLPTEAQWEYGCRAGTGTPWWPGPTASALAGCANLLDRTGVRQEPAWGRQEGDFDDERTSVAPVGRYRANAFGLFDVHGNVWEWCLDEYGSYTGAVRAGDGLRLLGDGSGMRTYRGGGFNAPASRARSSSRYMHAASFRVSNVGLRAARAVRP